MNETSELDARERAKLERDRKIPELKKQGKSNREIAKEVGADEGTVRKVLSAEKRHSSVIPHPTHEIIDGHHRFESAVSAGAVPTPYQEAPAMKPQANEALQPGDHVEIVGMGGRWFTVKDASDPALILVETDTGRQFKTGRQCITRVRRAEA